MLQNVIVTKVAASIAGFLFFLERVSSGDNVLVAVSIFIQASFTETTHVVLGRMINPQPIGLFQRLGNRIECSMIFYGSDIRTQLILIYCANLFQHNGGWTIKPVTLTKENMRRKIHPFADGLNL